MGTYVFKTPDVGEGIVEVEVVEWHVAVGDVVKEDQPLADVMTDKANVEISSPVAGTVSQLACEPGDSVAVGAQLILFEVAGEGTGEAETADQEKAADVPSAATSGEPAAVTAPVETTAPPQPAPTTAAPPRPGSKPLASPAVRRRALDAGIDLGRVPASGPAGRITHTDLDAFVASGGRLAAPQGRVARSGTELVKLIGLRRMIAAKMAESKRNIPHFSYVEEIDVTELDALRQELNANQRGERARLTLLPFLMLATVRAVERYPQCNATFDDEAGIVTRFHGVHLGIATQTDEGLKVPVVRHAETMDVWECAAEVQRLSQAARDKTLGPAALSGSTITITSLGKLGGIASTPVINRPEVAIIGVNRAVDRVVVHAGQMAIRRMMNLSSSFDHRIVDGSIAAEMIQAMKGMLEHPATLFM